MEAASQAAPGLDTRLLRRARKEASAIAVLLLAAINFFLGLGTSSLFVDESLSWSISSAGLHDLLQQVKLIEITPPPYYLALHEWIGRGGSDSEAFMRLPSAIAGVGVVAAVMWVGSRLASRRAGLLAGGLAALSPLILEYAQQARAYVFAMLLATVAVGAYLELDRGSGHRRGWLAVLVVASIAAVWAHYTAGLVIAPLLAIGVVRSRFRRAEAVAVLGIVGLGWLALLPALSDQLSHGNEKGIAAGAGFTADNMVQAIGAPFDGRYGGETLTFATAVGAAALTVAALVVARARGPLRTLALPPAYLPVVAVAAVTLAGTNVLITRYVAVAVPLMIIVLVAGALGAPRPLGLLIAGVALFSAVAGSIAAHTREGQYSDMRAVARQIAAESQPGDRVAVVGPEVRRTLLGYYLGKQGPKGKLAIRGRPTRGERLWIVEEPPRSRSELEPRLRPFSYRVAGLWRFTPGFDQQLVLAVPR